MTITRCFAPWFMGSPKHYCLPNGNVNASVGNCQRGAVSEPPLGKSYEKFSLD